MIIMLLGVIASSTNAAPPVTTGDPHRYWRILVQSYSADSTTDYISLADVELRESLEGGNVLGEGTAIASEFRTGFEPALGFDGDPATAWSPQQAALTASPPVWLGYDFGEGNAYNINAVSITAREDYPFHTPSAWDLQYSDDGVNWTTKWSVAGQDRFMELETREYNAIRIVKDAPLPEGVSALHLTPDPAQTSYTSLATYPFIEGLWNVGGFTVSGGVVTIPAGMDHITVTFNFGLATLVGSSADWRGEIYKNGAVYTSKQVQNNEGAGVGMRVLIPVAEGDTIHFAYWFNTSHTRDDSLLYATIVGH